MVNQAFVALGSNLGDPAHQLRIAAAHLKALSVADFAASSIWQSEPEGFDEQVSPFCNAVVRLGFDGSARELLDQLQRLELMLGRQVHARRDGGYESRIMDLDLIDFCLQRSDQPDLQLPHPRAHQRLFVLMPLREIDSTFMFPGRSKTLKELIHQAPDNVMTNKGPLEPLALGD